jgi:hypothetical protein
MQRSASRAGDRNPKINCSRQKSIHLGIRILEVTGYPILVLLSQLPSPPRDQTFHEKAQCAPIDSQINQLLN